jgi:hypothetical protein
MQVISGLAELAGVELGSQGGGKSGGIGLLCEEGDGREGGEWLRGCIGMQLKG